MTPPKNQAARAYRLASEQRSIRAQEADVFLQVTGALRISRNQGALDLVRALADNTRLWAAVISTLRDPDNQLPDQIRADMISVGLAVQRESASQKPDIDFLISVNENIASGLRVDKN